MFTGRAGHDPARMLDWDCLACDKPWPCDPAREELLATHDAVQLRIAMWDALEEAVHILPPTPATELFERFLRWTDRVGTGRAAG